MKDLKKIQEFFSKPLQEATFKIGDKITYLDYPGEIIGVRTDTSGKTHYTVSYNKGTNRRRNVVQGIYNKGGEIKLAEAKKEDPVDTITMDIPLFLRMLEYSREDASEDMDLHDVTEKANKLGKEKGILSMEDYDAIVSAAEEIDEAELTEAYVPSNIKEFAKRKGVSSLVNKVAGWAERVGKRITGGTAIGYNYSTLVLDMEYQGSEIRINTDNDTVTLYNEPVNSFAQFKSVYDKNNGTPGNNLEERIAEAFNKINENKGSITGPEWDSMDTKSRIKLLRYHFPKLSLKFADWNWDNLTPMIKNKLTGKSVKENTDYIKRRQSQNDYAINKKDKPSKSTNPKYSGKTDYMKRRQKELTEIIFNKLKK